MPMKFSIILILAIVVVHVTCSPARRSRKTTTENPAPKPVVRVLSDTEIEASNGKAIPVRKSGKRIRNNSRFEGDGDSKIEVLRINTIDAGTENMSKFV